METTTMDCGKPITRKQLLQGETYVARGENQKAATWMSSGPSVPNPDKSQTALRGRAALPNSKP